MKFQELLDKDKYGAFVNYMRVSDAKKLNVIPPDFHHIFSDLCDCGSDRIIRKITRSEIRCCNPRCPIKLPYYLEKALAFSGVKGIGLEMCRKAMNEYYSADDINSHIKFLTMESVEGYDLLNNHERGLIQEAFKLFKQRQVTYADLIASLSIPEFGTTSHNVFGGVSSTTHFVSLVEEEGGFVTFMANRGVKDPMKLFYFTEFIMDIIDYEESIRNKMILPSSNEIRVVTTGPLIFKGVKIVTSAFIEGCNKMGFLPDGRRLFSVKDTDASMSVDYIICQEGYHSRKANDGRSRERANPGKKLLYTCDEFVELLQKVKDNFLEKEGISNDEQGLASNGG